MPHARGRPRKISHEKGLEMARIFLARQEKESLTQRQVANRYNMDARSLRRYIRILEMTEPDLLRSNQPGQSQVEQSCGPLVWVWT